MQNTCIMPTLQIRNLPKGLYDQIVDSAKKSRRSLTQQAIVLLEQALIIQDLNRRKNKKLFLEQLIRNPPLTGVDSEQAIEWIRHDREQ